MYHFNNTIRSVSVCSLDDPLQKRPHAFTMIEVAMATALLATILSSVLLVMNRYAAAAKDLQLTQKAFELARGHMEQLLTENKLPDISEFGTSETNPDIEWQTRVEPFYEPVTNQMWIRAVCSAGFTDSKGEFENIELEHWITNLNAGQVRQILAQQEVEAEYLELLSDGEDSLIEETTLAYLEEKGLDEKAYKRFIEQQRRKKLEYISENGLEGYEAFLDTLKEEENEFLENLGMDFDEYNEFAADYVPKSRGFPNLFGDFGDTGSGDMPQVPSPAPDSPRRDPLDIPWDRIPPELVSLIEQLLGIKKPQS